MSIERIITALGNDESLIAEVQEAFNSKQTNSQNVERITQLELAKAEVVQKRDSLKAMVRNVTGLDELSEANLKGAFGDQNESYRALQSDNEVLQTKVGDLSSELDGLSGKHESQISNMMMLETLRGLDIDKQVYNTNALQDLAKDLLKGATREGYNFSFKNEDGTSIFNSRGEEANIQDRIEELRENENTYYFKQTQGAGGGNKEVVLSPSAKSDQEIADYFNKHGRLPDDYGKSN